MNLARNAWDDNDVPRVLDLLERHVPAPGEPDWRSFEWYYLLGLCNRDELTIPCGYSGNRPAFSPDGKILAVGTRERGWAIELWDLHRHERVKVLQDTVATGPLAFSPDGTTLASAGGAEVKLWDVATGKLLRTFGGHQHAILTIAFTPDGKRVVSTDGGNLDSKDVPGVIRVWDAATGERLQELTGHTKFIWSIAVSPNGERLVSAGLDEVRFWNLLTGEPIEGMMVKTAEEGGGVAWSPEGDLLATYYQGHVVLWDAATGNESRRFVAPATSLAGLFTGGKAAGRGTPRRHGAPLGCRNGHGAVRLQRPFSMALLRRLLTRRKPARLGRPGLERQGLARAGEAADRGLDRGQFPALPQTGTRSRGGFAGRGAAGRAAEFRTSRDRRCSLRPRAGHAQRGGGRTRNRVLSGR